MFSKIGMRSRYHQLRIKEEDIPETTFMNYYNHYKFTIMSFGLTNAFAAFMDLMNQVFKDFLNIFMIIFIDNILIYSKKKSWHENHFKKVYIKFFKCEFLL